ncbi:zinc-ribbon domain-containing protein [Halostella salina]|uniref:zinc-ribbon domain-containing protein n=1 Tax=Halostella salina TaxID=1547897 RepID=UPI000EF7D342|nr:zinc-ribbon domain-containing protein [Halostella salina]
MEYCPECGTEARTDVTYCPGCGTDLTEYRQWSPSADAAPDDAPSEGADADAGAGPDAGDQPPAGEAGTDPESAADAVDHDREGPVDDADDGTDRQRPPAGAPGDDTADAASPGDETRPDARPGDRGDGDHDQSAGGGSADDRPVDDPKAGGQRNGSADPQTEPDEPRDGHQPGAGGGRGTEPDRNPDRPDERSRRAGQDQPPGGRQQGQPQGGDRRSGPDPQRDQPRDGGQQPGHGQPPGQGDRPNEPRQQGGRQQQGRGGQPAPNAGGGQPAGGRGRANQPQGGRQAADPQPAGGAAGQTGGNQWQGEATGGTAQGRGTAVDRTPSFTDRLTALPFARSLGVGAALYVATYAVTYLAFLADVLVLNASKHELSASNLMPLSPVDNATASMWQFVGWLFYEGQMVTIEETRVMETGGQQESTTEAISLFEPSYWTQFQGISDIIVTSALYTAVPVLVLIAGSALFVKYQRGRADDSPSGMLLGASVVVGYAVLAAAGSLLFSATHTDFESSAMVELSRTPVLMEAVMFPAAFALVAGAVGGIVADSLGDDDAPAAQPRQ